MINCSQYLDRTLAGPLRAALASHPVVVVAGARQTGKSTLVQRLAGRVYRTLDDLDLLEQARREPEAFLAAAGALTVDEVHRAPELFLAIKRTVDRDRTAGRFLLTGSASLALLAQVASGLAGRAVHLNLGPLTCAERAGRAADEVWTTLTQAGDLKEAMAGLPRERPPLPWEERVLEGGLPPAALAASARARLEWFEGYLLTYLERDLRQLSQVSSLVDFRRAMLIGAQRTGQLVNAAELGRAAAIAQATMHRYLNLLETSGILIRLPPFASNRGKRLVRTPKLYWVDVGLAAFLARAHTAEEVRASPLAGALLENLVLAHLAAWRETRVPRPELCHYRTASGSEVDLVIEAGRKLLPIEVKASTRAGLGDATGLEAFLSEHARRAPFGVLLHAGREVRPLTARVLVVPLAVALGA
jgi:predicted AAA+ superfamily ATPase